jgi:hypothetical protein
MMSGTDSVAARVREALDALDAARSCLEAYHDAIASPAVESALPSRELLDQVERARDVLAGLHPALSDLRHGTGV